MYVKEIIDLTRREYLDDAVEPYEWKTEDLLTHLNTALNEWCRFTGCLRDWTTEAICKILILANKHTYAMDSRITEIHNGYLTNGSPIVYPKSDTWLDAYAPSWRRITGEVNWLLPDYGQNYLRTVYYPPTARGYWTGVFQFIALTNKLVQTGTDFRNYLAAGDQVIVSGTTLNGTTAVPKTFTVVTSAADSFTVSETVADETASSTIAQKVTDTLWLTVSRLPITQLTIGLMDSQSPEIRADYHAYLPYGIAREAFMKPGSDSFDPRRAKENRDYFEYYKRQARFERDSLRLSEATMKPHPGAI